MKKSQSKPDPFIEYLFRSDETSAVLKCHLELERNIDACLKNHLPNSDVITKWSFSNKVDVLFAIGILTKDIWDSLKVVNKIRNKFSHTYGYKLSYTDIAFLESIGDNKKLIIPDRFNQVPNLREITLMVKTISYFEGYLAI